MSTDTRAVLDREIRNFVNDLADEGFLVYNDEDEDALVQRFAAIARSAPEERGEGEHGLAQAIEDRLEFVAPRDGRDALWDAIEDIRTLTLAALRASPPAPVEGERERIAESIAEDLFVNGAGQRARRLVLELEDGHTAGGWCRGAVVDRILSALASHPVQGAGGGEREEMLDGIELAWGIIANASGGDWTRERPEWQGAARRWAHRFLPLLGRARAASPAPSAPGTPPACSNCGSTEIHLRGVGSGGTPSYRCRSCGRTYGGDEYETLPAPSAPEEERQ